MNVMNSIDTTRTSKFLSLVLRHKPETIGVTLDQQGWVDVDELLEKMNAKGHPISRAQLEQIVAENDKKRFAFSEDGRRIRANQGHSVAVDLSLRPLEPPLVLYHGTVRRNRSSIEENGLLKQQRQHVHLSADRETAQLVGQRYGKPVILEITAQQMQKDGYAFFRSENGVWLTDQVPPAYIVWPDEKA